MRKTIIPTDTIEVGPHLFNIVLNLSGSYTLYLDIGGSAYQVLGTAPAPNSLIMYRTSTPTRDIDWDIKVSANYLQNGNQFSVYCVIATPTLAGEFSS